MRVRLAVAVATCLALGACSETQKATAPASGPLRWGWDNPLGTGSGYDPDLVCSQTAVAHGDSLTCTFANGNFINFPRWEFVTDDGFIIQGPNGGFTFTWSGKMVKGGSVHVDWVDPATSKAGPTLTQAITVQRRSWTWTDQLTGGQGAAGELDSCDTWDAVQHGLTASANCTEDSVGDLFTPVDTSLTNGNGYVAAQVTDGGPNTGLWYVDTTSSRMALRSQIKKLWRSDADGLSLANAPAAVTTGCQAAYGNTNPRNHNAVNTVCTSLALFSSFVACIWNHEGQHITAAITAARSPQNDLWARFEPEVGRTAAELREALRLEQGAANLSVARASLAAHSSMSSHGYIFWIHDGSKYGSGFESIDC